MGTTGLALPWKARISSTLRERGTRVEPSEHIARGPSPAAVDATSEDAALAAACRSGDLRAYERLYAMHGARMKNLARNVAQHRELSRAIEFRDLDVPDPDQHVLRRATEPDAKERSRER